MRVEISTFNNSAHLAFDQYAQAVHEEIDRLRNLQAAAQEKIEHLQLSLAEAGAAIRKVAGLPEMAPPGTVEDDVKRIAAKLAPASRGDDERTEADEQREVANG